MKVIVINKLAHACTHRHSKHQKVPQSETIFHGQKLNGRNYSVVEKSYSNYYYFIQIILIFFVALGRKQCFYFGKDFLQSKYIILQY